MNFDWTEEDKALKNSVVQTFDDAARVEIDAMEDAGTTELKGTVTRYLKKLASTGYLEHAVGLGNRHRILRLMAGQEELARLSGNLFLSVEVTARLFAGLLSSVGKPQQVNEIVEAVQRGELIAAVATSEPSEPGSPAGMNTHARQEGDAYRLTGKKSFVTNGPIADCIAVVGLVEDSPAVFLVEPGQEGLAMGERLRTLGYNGLAVSSLELNEVRIPLSKVLGPLEDKAALEEIRLLQDLILSIASVGLMQRTLAAARQHAGSHEREGKPVAARQEIRFKLAEMLTLTQTSQLLTYRAGWMYADNNPETATLVRCAKVFASEASEQVANMAMQIMAGQGYVWGNVVERGYRDAKYAALAGTTSELARMSIAEDLLNRYR